MRKISFLFSLFLMSCLPQQKEKNTTTKQIKTFADSIVEKSIEHHGGIALWKRIKTLSFTKEIILFTKEGTVASKQTQAQAFYFNPNLEGTIQWKKGENNHIVRFKNDTITKTIHTISITDSIALKSARNQFFAAHYVINQPFKLKDKSVLLKYTGIEKLDNQAHHAIEVRTKNDVETSDVWTYYFDTKTCQLNATKVIHNNKISIIKNNTFNNNTGILWNQHRESFFTDSLGNISYMRAKYFYDNFKIELKK